MQPSTLPQAAANRRTGWWPLPAILGLGAALVVAIWSANRSFTGKPSVDILSTVIATELLLFLWLMTISPLAASARIGVLCAVFGIELLLPLLACIAGFHGDGRPIFTWRWAAGSSYPSEDRSDSGAAMPTAGKQPDVDLTVTALDDYPGLRGSDRSAAVLGADLADDWVQSPPRQLWRQSIGEGWSSFAVTGQFCVTAEQRGNDEAVVCYELRSGLQRWQHRDRAHFQELMGGNGPRATPTISAGNVYSLGATGILNCLDGATGRPIWTRNVLKDGASKNAPFGMCGSPLVVGQMVVVSPGGKQTSLVAYDRTTGERLWAAGDADAAYSSPQWFHAAGGDQILSFNADGLTAHDPQTGQVLWHYDWVTPPERNNVCQPICFSGADGEPDRVFISSGYGKGCALLEVVRESQNGKWDVDARWTNKLLKSKFASAVAADGFVYGLDDGILTCLDLRTGNRCWKQGHYGHGQLLLANDLLLVQAESGEVVLVARTPKAHRELTRFAALDSRTWNHPVLTGNLLLVRNDREAACYELPQRAQ